MNIDHFDRARAAWPLLVNRSNQRLPPYTYREICTELRVHWRNARHFLLVIREHCSQNALPPLQALVVNAATRLPGAGCVGSPTTHAELQETLIAIYEHRWPTVAPF